MSSEPITAESIFEDFSLECHGGHGEAIRLCKQHWPTCLVSFPLPEPGVCRVVKMRVIIHDMEWHATSVTAHHLLCRQLEKLTGTTGWDIYGELLSRRRMEFYQWT